MKIFSVFVTIIISISSIHARAEFPEFEPSMICLAGAAGGYMASDPGNEMVYAGIGCAVGYFIGQMVNDHYRDKYTEKTRRELDEAQKVIDKMILAQAEASSKGEARKTGWYRTRVKTVRGGRMPNGSIRKPTLEVELESPAMTDDVNIRFGR